MERNFVKVKGKTYDKLRHKNDINDSDLEGKTVKIDEQLKRRVHN